MPSTERRARRIDVQLPQTGGGALISSGGPAAAGPSLPAPGAPQNLRLINPVLLYSAVTPAAGVTAVWLAPAGLAPDDYLVQWATDAGFTAPTSYAAARGQTSLGIPGLPVDRDIYVRVAARANKVQGGWSATASLHTPSDTTPPDPPYALAWTWQRTGDLLLIWSNPTSPNLRDVEIRIWNDVTKSVEYTAAYSSGRDYTWSLAENLRATSNAPDGTVYVELRARSWGGVFSTVAVPLTQPSKAPPAQPTDLTVNFSGPDAIFTWTAAADATAWALTIDGTVYDSPTATYTYPYAQNRADHGGAADPSLSYSLVAKDGLGQSSTALAGTATNAAPAATTAAALGGFSTLAVTITPSSAADLRHYRVRVYRNAVLVRTILTTETFFIVDTTGTGSGSYTADVTVEDLFGQQSSPSAQTSAAALTDQAAYVADLRSGLLYTDSAGTADTNLATLKDGRTDLTTVVVYPAGTTWSWTQADWQSEITHQTSELYLSVAASCYIGTSLDGATWTWHTGGTNSGGRWQPVAYASEAAAQGAATTISAGLTRVDLPAAVRCRYIRLGSRNTGAVYGLREFFPSTLVRGTYVQAESVTTLLLAAGAVTADILAAGAVTAGKISVTTLSAISANMGTITAGTITGATIRSAASGARWEANSTRLFGTDGTTTQWEVLNANGKFTAGEGNVVLDASGLQINAGVTTSKGRLTLTGIGANSGYVGGLVGTTPAVALGLIHPDAVHVGRAFGAISSGSYSGAGLLISSSGNYFGGDLAISGHTTIGAASLTKNLTVTGTATISGNYLYGSGSAAALRMTDSWLRLNQNPAGGSDFANGVYTPGNFRADGAIYLGNTYYINDVASGLVTNGNFSVSGNFDASGFTGLRTGAWSGAALIINGPGTTSSTYGLVVRDSAGTNTFWVNDAGTGYLRNNPITYSDIRKKRGIAAIPDALDRIMRLWPCSFERIDALDRGRQFGLIAQYSAPVVPELVIEHVPPGRTEPEYHMDYVGVVPLLIGAVQQLTRRIAALEEAGAR